MAVKVSGTTVIDDSKNMLTDGYIRAATYKGKTQTIATGSGAKSVNLSTGDNVLMTLTGNTSFTITNLLSSYVNTVTFKLTYSGGAWSVTWPTGTTWHRNVSPSSSTSGTAIYVLETYDNGSSWHGIEVWRSWA